MGFVGWDLLGWGYKISHAAVEFTWQFTVVFISSSKELTALFWPPRVPGINGMRRHPCRQNIRIHKKCWTLQREQSRCWSQQLASLAARSSAHSGGSICSAAESGRGDPHTNKPIPGSWPCWISRQEWVKCRSREIILEHIVCVKGMCT